MILGACVCSAVGRRRFDVIDVSTSRGQLRAEPMKRRRLPGTALCCALVTGTAACATGLAAAPQQSDLTALREELAAQRRIQEELRLRLERLEARNERAAYVPAPRAVEAVDPVRALPVVKMERPRDVSEDQSPDVDTTIPIRDPSGHSDIVVRHAVREKESPIDLNAIVAQDAAQDAAKGEGKDAGKDTSRRERLKAKDDQSDADFQMAVMKYNSGEYVVAAAEFELFATRHPKHDSAAEAYYLGGLAQVAAGHCPQAKPLFEAVVTNYPGGDVAGRALLGLAQCESKTGHDAQARNLFMRVLDEHPRSAEASQAQAALADLPGAASP